MTSLETPNVLATELIVKHPDWKKLSGAKKNEEIMASDSDSDDDMEESEEEQIIQIVDENMQVLMEYDIKTLNHKRSNS